MPKIPVEIVGKAFTKLKNCEIRGKLVVLKKETKEHPEYAAEFDESCILTREFGRIRKTYQRRLMIIEGAKKCISFASKRGVLDNAPPGLDFAAIQSHFDAEVAKKQGQVHTKLDVPTSLYIFLVVIMILQFISMIMNSGRIQVV